MRYVFFIFLSVLTVFGDNPYRGIVERNGFELTAEKPTQVLPPIATLPLTSVYLTGIARKDKIHTAYMAIKDKTQNKFLGLREGEKKDGVEVVKIMRDTVFISYNGILRELTFKQNSLPSFVTKAASKQKTKDKREERGERGRSSSRPQTATNAPSRASGPQVVTVPSRRPKIDPRIIERGLEYLSKTEDNEKREYLLKRLESLQNRENRR
jgi:type II secretory pathway component PulC